MGCTPSKASVAECRDAKKSEGQTVTEEPADKVLTQATPGEKALTQLGVIFDSIEKSADGSVCKLALDRALEKDSTEGGLLALIKEAGMKPDFSALRTLDTNKDGRVTWEEFRTSLHDVATKEVEARGGELAAVDMPASEKAIVQLKALFKCLDINSDDGVDKEEFAKGLNNDVNLGKLVEEAGFNKDFYVLEALDTNKDGKITWEEFETHLKAAAKAEVIATGNVTAAVTGDAAVILQELEVADPPRQQQKGWFSCCSN